eukprot:scpid106777/ scgid14227/ 
MSILRMDVSMLSILFVFETSHASTGTTTPSSHMIKYAYNHACPHTACSAVLHAGQNATPSCFHWAWISFAPSIIVLGKVQSVECSVFDTAAGNLLVFMYCTEQQTTVLQYTCMLVLFLIVILMFLCIVYCVCTCVCTSACVYVCFHVFVCIMFAL